MALRPIDGEALWDKLEDALWYDNYDRDMAEKIVLDMPTLIPSNEPRAGLYGKYTVYKNKDGSLVTDCFILRPAKDPAAVAALMAYAATTDNAELAADIINWVGSESNEPISNGQELRTGNGLNLWAKKWRTDMQLQEIIRRAEKELFTATRNLDAAKRRGAPEQDVRNLEVKVEYKEAVLEILNGGHLELFGKVEQLKNENADLLDRVKSAETRCDTLEKTVKEYQNEIVPGYRERAEKAEREKNEAREVICTRCRVLPCRGNECYWYRGQKEE